jgi:outer membrane protein
MFIRGLIAALAILIAAPAAHAQTVKVASMDSQRVLLGVKDGKAAKARLTAWLEPQQKSIDQTQAALRQEKLAVDAIADPAERARRTAQLQTKVSELAQRWEASRTEAAERERREMEPILAKMDRVTKVVAAREGYTLVLEKNGDGVRYSAPGVGLGPDITDKIIQAYDAAP